MLCLVKRHLHKTASRLRFGQTVNKNRCSTYVCLASSYGTYRADCLFLFQAPVVPRGRLVDRNTYIVTVKFWYERLTSDNDLVVGVCDDVDCVGFHYRDNGDNIYAVKWVKDHHACLRSNNRLNDGWRDNNSEMYEMKFEFSPSNTHGDTWTYAVGKPFRQKFDVVMRLSHGMWLSVCRDSIDEAYSIRSFEFFIRQN